jgi:predicted LPLAT superfamily acyltransferase
MRERSSWERAVRRIVTETFRLVPPVTALGAIEQLAPCYARLALRTGGVLLPRSLRDFPDKVAPYFAADRGRERRARLVEARLVFLLTRLVLNQVVRGSPGAESRRLLPIAVDGADHLDAALAERRGLVLVSAHFGLPVLIRLVVEGRGARVVGVGESFTQGVDMAIGRDVWTRARALQRLRAEVEGGNVCVLLADVRGDRYIETPFLQGHIPVVPGAFVLARATRSPLLPVFAVRAPGAWHFRVAFGPPLSLVDRARPAPFADIASSFARCFEAIARDHPDHLFAYDPVFGASPGAPRSSAGGGPPSRSARA